MDLQLTLPLVYTQPGQERTQVVPQSQYQTHEVTEQEDKQRTRLMPNMVMVDRRNTGVSTLAVAAWRVSWFVLHQLWGKRQEYISLCFCYYSTIIDSTILQRY